MQILPGSRRMRLIFSLVIGFFLFESSAVAFADGATHLRLIAPLDRPQDGYCIDVVGTPGNLRTDLPLFAHNCKPVLSSDSAVIFDSQGMIRFTALDLCVTVAGINGGALPGAAVLLQECGSNTAFMQTTPLQTFAISDSGQLTLTGGNLCLSVGTESATTYSAQDSWRTLFVDDCRSVDDDRSRWQFSKP